MEYRECLKEYDDMVLYTSIILPEYVENALIDISEIMGIEVDMHYWEKFIRESLIDLNKSCYYQDDIDPRRFIYIDCIDLGDLYAIFIRCLKAESNIIKESFSKWVKITLEAYDQTFDGNLIDWMHDEKYKKICSPLYNTLVTNKLINE